MKSKVRWAAQKSALFLKPWHPLYGIPFYIWERQWQIYDLIGYRQGSEEIVIKMELLSQKEARFRPWYLFYRSHLEMYRGEFEKAFNTLAEVTPEEWDLLPAMDRGRFLERKSEASQHLSSYDQAIEYRRQAMDIYARHGEADIYARNLSAIGLIYWKKGDYREALRCLEESIKTFHQNGDWKQLALALTNKANVLLAIEETEKACCYYREALEICRRIGDVSKQGAILNNLGAIFFRQGDYTGASEFFQQGYHIDEMLGNLCGQAAKLSNMAVMSATLGNYREALDKFTRALALERETGNLEGQMRKLSNLASLYNLMDDCLRAQECIKEAIDIGRRIGARGYLSYCLSMLGEFQSRDGRLEEAEANLREAMDLVEGSGNLSILANCHSHLAGIYLAKGKESLAREHSSSAVSLVQNNELFEINKESIFFVHYQVVSKQGESQEALSWLEKAYHEVMAKLGNLPQGIRAQEIINKNVVYSQIIREWEKRRLES